VATRSDRTPRLAPALRREQLLDAALDVLTEGGFGALSVEAVARQAGVTRPVVYDAFGDLDGLLLALIDREEEAALAPLLEIVGDVPAAGVDPDAFLVEGLLAFLSAVKANPRTWRLVLMPPRGTSAELRQRIRRSRRLIAERITTLLDWGISQRGGPSGLDHPLLARLIVAAGEDAARLMLAHPRRFPPERLVAVARDWLVAFPADLPRRGEPPPELAIDPAPAMARGTAPASPPASGVAAGGRRMPRSDRREQLLDVTLELLAEHGFEALSMEAIARRAGVNRVVVYRSYANLQVLVVALLRREDRRVKRTLDAILPREATKPPGRLLGEVLAGFLQAVMRKPQTWRLALLRPEAAPVALQKVVNRRRTALARRLEPLVGHGLKAMPGRDATLDVELLARMLLSIGEEQGRLALDDPEFPPARLVESSWRLLDALPTG
jgi:AcrR family transcriptional regulator